MHDLDTRLERLATEATRHAVLPEPARSPAGVGAAAASWPARPWS
jgi:hypothetical protein